MVRVAEEAQKSVKGMEDNVIHSKYIELVNFHLHLPTVTLVHSGTLTA